MGVLDGSRGGADRRISFVLSSHIGWLAQHTPVWLEGILVSYINRYSQTP